MEDKELTMLKKAMLEILRYNPYVYPQSASISGKPGEILIRFPYSELPKNSLLYVLPNTNSIQIDGDTKNTLRVKFGKTNAQGEIEYTNDKYYDIVVEQSNGLKRYASDGHIVANRLAIFRVGNVDDGTITLINSPLYNEISLASLVVTNNAVFYDKPLVKLKKDNEDDPDEYVEVVTKDQYNELLERVQYLEQKFQVGTVDAETALAGQPDGTFYVKVEEN